MTTETWVNKTRCPRCGQVCQPIEVHGHTQCNVCGSVMEECCQGETVSEAQEKREDADKGDGV